jgi:hypothetical protein
MIQIYEIGGTTIFIFVSSASKVTILQILSGCPIGDSIPTILYPRLCDQNNGDERRRRAVGNVKVEISLTTLLSILDTGIVKILAETHTAFNSHAFCVRITGRGECA